MRIYLSDKAATELGKQAELFSATGSLIGRAIIETIIKEGILDEILAGVDLSEFQTRIGRVRGRGMYSFAGQRLSSTGMSDLTGIPAYVIRRRIELGWDIERAATTPVGKSRFKVREAAE